MSHEVSEELVRPVRLRRAQRDQVVPIPAKVDALLPEDHLARLLWQALERLDLSAFTATLVVVEGGPGRAAADPQVLVALWLYATSQGVTRARALNRLCTEHLAYLWLCGGVTMNYHTLSDFRVQHVAALRGLFVQVLGCLRAADLVAFEHVAQDGLRVRASAGAASFRRRPTLEQSLAEARAFLAQLPPDEPEEADQADDRRTGTAGPTRGQRAAQARAARERVARLEAALAALPAAEAAKAPKERDRARVSTTDAEARVMKMADGGFRPAYNLQFAADTGHQAIVGVDVTTCGSDMAQAPPMVAQVAAHMGYLPQDWLMDGGFASHEAIQQVAAHGVRVLAPVQTPKEPTRDPYLPRPADPPVIATWRQRMGTDEAHTTYRLRAQTIECVNAQARQRHGLQQVPVRGLAKVRCIAWWIALTHNLLLWLSRRPAAVAA